MVSHVIRDDQGGGLEYGITVFAVFKSQPVTSVRKLYPDCKLGHAGLHFSKSLHSKGRRPATFKVQGRERHDLRGDTAEWSPHVL